MGIYYHPFCFAFHLTEVCIRYETLKPVIHTIGQAYFALAMTLLLFVMIIYWFSVFGFRFFHYHYIFNNEANDNEIPDAQLVGAHDEKVEGNSEVEAEILPELEIFGEDL